MTENQSFYNAPSSSFINYFKYFFAQTTDRQTQSSGRFSKGVPRERYRYPDRLLQDHRCNRRVHIHKTSSFFPPYRQYV